MSLREWRGYINEILPDHVINVEDKNKNINSGILYTFLRLQKMFKWEGLPDTIPQKYLEFYLMINGHCAFFEERNNFYVCKGGFGGDPDAYYLPQNYVVANPYLKLSKTFIRDKDCVVIGNDSSYYGLYALVSKYISLLAENEISMNMSVINSRIMSIIIANTDNEKLSADDFIADLKEGKLSSMVQEPFFEGIKVQPYANASQSNALTSLIEYEQYLKASLLNDIGLNANYNMKRESINSNESQLNDDMLTPLIDDMLAMRKEAADKINDMFGLNITVDFDSAWEENEVTKQIELENMEGEKNDDVDDQSDSSSAGDGASEVSNSTEEQEDDKVEDKEGEEEDEDEKKDQA